MTYTIEQIKELCEKATDEVLDQNKIYGCLDGGCIVKRKRGMVTNGGCHCLDHPSFEKQREIARYIRILRGEVAASRTIIPELVAEVESLQKQLKEARAVIEFYSDKDIWDPEIGFIQVSDRDLDGFHGCKAREWLEKWREK